MTRFEPNLNIVLIKRASSVERSWGSGLGDSRRDGKINPEYIFNSNSRNQGDRHSLCLISIRAEHQRMALVRIYASGVVEESWVPI